MRRLWWFGLLVLCMAGAMFVVIFPVMIVQPFKYQDPVQLLRALAVFRIAPAIAMPLAAIAILTLGLAWARLRTIERVSAVSLALLTCGAAALTEVNIYEKMFHPAGQPKFLAARDAKAEPDDMLVTVALNGEAHAYPIREMGYHHIVNDVVGGVPIVATY